jgi:hypothetical protein
MGANATIIAGGCSAVAVVIVGLADGVTTARVKPTTVG